MKVTVKLFANLARLRSGIKAGNSFEVDLNDDATVKDLTDLLKIPKEEVHIVFINNIIQESDSKLRDGDVIGIFPPVGGG